MLANSHLIFRLQNALKGASSSDSARRSQSERQLTMLRQELSYPLLILSFLSNQSLNIDLGLRAAIELKLWCKRYKGLQDYQIQQLQKPVLSIKASLVGYYSVCNSKIAVQLQDAIKSLASRDYFKAWPNLPSQLIAQANQNYMKILRVLKIVKGITYRYSYQLRSDPLYQEIIFSCDSFHDWLLNLAKTIVEDAKNSTDPLCFKSLKTLLRAFYHLNYQDLHPKFEDNLKIWMALLVESVRLSKHVQGYPLIKVRGQAMKGLILFANSYRDDIGAMVHQFTQQIWQLCSKTKPDLYNQHIIISGLKFFRTLSYSKDMLPFFQNGLTSILQTLVYPQLGLTKNLQQKFNDQPDIYFQHIFLRGDISSLRSVTVQLLQSLTKNFKPKQYFQQIMASISKQVQNGTATMPNQILAINLACDGLNHLFRAQEGCVGLNIEGQPIISMGYHGIIRPNLNKLYQAVTNKKNITQVMSPFQYSFYLRFIFIFRNYIPKEQIAAILGLIGSVISCSEGTIRNYSAAVIQSLVSLKNGDFKDFTNKAKYFSKTHHTDLMSNCGQVLSLAGTQPLNQHIIRCVRTLIQILQEQAQHYFQPFCQLFNVLIKKLNVYQFQRAFQIFDGLGMLLKNVLPFRPQLLKGFQSSVLPVFSQLLKKSSDLVNFIFQIYAIIVQILATPPQSAQSLLASVLVQSNWQQANSSLFLSYIAYLKAFSKPVPDLFLLKQQQCKSIIQQLASLSKDQSLYTFLQIIIKKLEIEKLLQSGWIQFALRLYLNLYKSAGNNPGSQIDNTRKTVRPAINKNFVRIICQLFCKGLPTMILNQGNKIVPNLIIDILTKQRLMISRIQRLDRKTIFVGLANLLFDLQVSSNMPNQQWAALLSALIQNVGNKRALWISLKQQQARGEDQSFKKLRSLQLNKQERVDEQLFLANKIQQGQMNHMTKNMYSLLPPQNIPILNQLFQSKLG